MEKNELPPWLDRSLYPFESKWMTVDGHDLHYVDEGEGPVLLFIHGTPEWSFGYRNLIRSLRTHYRCIGPDLLGFGLSAKPHNGTYTCAAHADRLKKFIRTLQLENITLVANDFGGSIGLRYAADAPENIQSVVLFNTWAWPLSNNKHYSAPAKIMNTWLGKFLYLKMNFPVNVIMPAAFGNKALLTAHVHKHYKEALPPGSRHAAYAFSKELLNASAWWQTLWEDLPVLEKKPMLIFWGLKDKFIPPYELEKWKSRFPEAVIHTFEDAGHFVQEEKGMEMSLQIKNFLDKQLGMVNYQ